jgi:nitrogen fixation protein NifU and related proteins
MSLEDLYQQMILDHNRAPRNFRPMDAPTHRARGYNPFCGDEYEVFFKVDETGTIRDAAFQGHGCAISKAAASLMTEELRGKSVALARELFDAFQALVTGHQDVGADPSRIGKLGVFKGVSQYPSRVKCAALCCHAARAALEGGSEVSTES